MHVTYGEKLLLWESGLGRELGWDVEIEGRRVARLVRALDVGMFWVSYEVEPAAEDPVVAGRVLERRFWLEEGSRLVYRSRVIGNVTAKWVVASARDVGPCRVAFRGLYADVGTPRIWDRCVLMLRRIK